MTRWRNLGLIFEAEGAVAWARDTALQPTPVAKGDQVRVFVGMRDADGVSRVGWIDLDRSRPTPRLEDVSLRPALDIGEPGCFDDNGVVPCAVVADGDELRLYYAGYQLGTRARFNVFGGLAVSRDFGATFERVHRVPVVERSDEAPLFRVVHSLLEDGDGWRAWYGGGDRFEPGPSGRPTPSYDIRTMRSPDGVSFPPAGEVCIELEPGEVRVGRPYVLRREDGGYEMFFGAQRLGEGYDLARATSADGVGWRRDAHGFDVERGPDGWDRGMRGYPAVVESPHGRLLLYNGADMGRAGFGCAIRD